MSNRQLEDIIRAIEPMLNSRLSNYIIPGLNSQLVGGELSGKVRLFSTDREAKDFITPHSHRFDFTCLVLRGFVTNTIYTEVGDLSGDEWIASTINQVCGSNGLMDYKHTRDALPTRWTQRVDAYTTGDTYSMKSNELHSIQFQKGSRVLFFEGPQLTSTSRMIEPWVNGKLLPTFRTEPWMFQRDVIGETE